jgi:hypothetical protein
MGGESLEGKRPLESLLVERMPAKQDASTGRESCWGPESLPVRCVRQIFSLEDIYAISLLPPPPIDPSDDLAEPESLDLADDPPPPPPISLDLASLRAAADAIAADAGVRSLCNWLRKSSSMLSRSTCRGWGRTWVRRCGRHR